MSIKNFFDGGKQVSDSAGLPLSGGKCYFYEPGTTTLKSSYTTSAVAVANANPVVLDSAGRANIWLNGNYRVIVKDSTGATTIYDEDNINPETASSLTAISGDTTLVLGDKGKFIQASGAITITLTSAATLGAGWYAYIRNNGSSNITLTSANTGNTFNTIAFSTTTHIIYVGEAVLVAVNSAADGFVVFSAAEAATNVCEGRLTLTSATPVTTADVTGATTVYFTPYVGDKISLYDGALWRLYKFTELSLALGAVTSGLPYDIFCYNNNGTLTLEKLAWTNTTTRATALAYQNGVLCKTGALTRRYLGTLQTTSATATEDSIANRYLWNYYNRKQRPMKAVESTTNWAYTVATFREARAQTTNRLNFMVGVSDDAISARVIVTVSNDTPNISCKVGIGLDATSVNSADIYNRAMVALSNARMIVTAEYNNIVTAGVHSLSWLEYSEAAGVTTWYGIDTTTTCQSGIFGTVMA